MANIGPQSRPLPSFNAPVKRYAALWRREIGHRSPLLMPYVPVPKLADPIDMLEWTLQLRSTRTERHLVGAVALHDAETHERIGAFVNATPNSVKIFVPPQADLSAGRPTVFLPTTEAERAENPVQSLVMTMTTPPVYVALRGLEQLVEFGSLGN